MALDIKIGDREARVRLVKKEGTKAIIDVDGIEYNVDIVMVEDGVYSIIHEGKSFNIELISGGGPKNYFVNTYNASHEVEIVDAQSRYRQSRNQDSIDSAEKVITTPMPGRVVKIPVNEGDEVAKGTTVIVISAMKMESEYRSPIDGRIKKVFVKEGDSITGNQPLIEIE
jgi:biotin carboxyl carrier protein